MTTRRKMPALLASARAYYRLAAKAEKAGNYREAGRYRGLADRKVREHRRGVEYRRRTFRTDQRSTRP
jgi:hypothetical protein